MTLAVEPIAPSEVVQGDSHVWTVTPLTGFAPGDGFTASVRFIAATTRVDGTAVAAGTDWSIRLSSATSAALPGGRVSWQLVVTDSVVLTDIRTIAAGAFLVIPLPKIGQGTAGVSQAERTLKLWLDRAEQQAADLLQEYDIGGTRRAKRYTPEQIRSQIAYWGGIVSAERNGGRARMRVHSVRF